MTDNRMTVRNIENETYQYLLRRSKELSTNDRKVSVNQVVSLILNQHCRNHFLKEELNGIEKLEHRLDSLTEAISDLTITYQEILERSV